MRVQKKFDGEAVLMAALAKFRETVRESVLGVTVVFDCVVGASGQKLFTTDFREAIENRRASAVVSLRSAG